MGEYIRGVVVKLHLTPEQEVMFKQNYGCTRKTHNELLNKTRNPKVIIDIIIYDSFYTIKSLSLQNISLCAPYSSNPL